MDVLKFITFFDISHQIYNLGPWCSADKMLYGCIFLSSKQIKPFPIVILDD